MMKTAQEMRTLSTEQRRFAPPEHFAQKANLNSLEQYLRLCEEAKKNPNEYWAQRAREELYWHVDFNKTLEWNPPSSMKPGANSGSRYAKWFLGGKTNLCFNALDRNLPFCANKNAIVFEGEPGDIERITYAQLHEKVSRLANVLKSLNVKPGDRVGIYLPLIPEAAVAMLACARIGAVHSVVFGGFSADSLADRMNDAGATVLLTADGGWRKASIVPLLENVREARKKMTSMQHVVVFERTKNISLAHNEINWNLACSKASTECEIEWVDSEHPLFILYTSGSTGTPKGVLHTTGGYGVWTSLTSRWIFDLQRDDLYWCTADVGWVTGHSYVVYGPLMNGASIFMYEGAPTTPAPNRFWSMIERHKISILYTAPTAIRAFMKLGESHLKQHNLSSLRLLGSVGEPINPEAWIWYHTNVGNSRCPIVDTWWQTETGGIMASPIPGLTSTKPGSATRPLPGISMEILDAHGNSIQEGAGKLFITKPWPSMLRTIWNNDDRFVKTYFSEVKDVYFTGDGARRDADGYFWILGRVDDVVNVAGHRLGTAEVESALVSHSSVAEAAVVGRPDDLKGTALVAFVTLKSHVTAVDSLKLELAAHVTKEIGAIARPDEIRFSPALPKTRSGKIMRRLLRDVAAGNVSTGDTSTLEDLSVLASLRHDDE
jgi:acetyl-CoA synthetase